MYNDIPVGLRVPSNLPLDAKLWIKSKVQLQTLGPSNNLAYTYYKGMRIYCADEKEIYEWMPVSEGNALSLIALSGTTFTYPSGYNVNGINYSNTTYALFLVPQAWDIVIPEPFDVDNVGSGADIYKGLNVDTHEFRGITTNVVQPSNPGQITGGISANASVNGDNIVIQLDFSTLSVPLQQVGIPEYYINSGGNDATADGSIVRPYKTWAACRDAIIGTGTFYNPQHNGVKVIFQTYISSDEDLTIKNVSYRFENNSVFTYNGSEEAVFDMDKLKANTNTSSNYFEGTGTIRGIDKDIILRAGATSPSIPDSGTYYHVTISTGSTITLESRFSSSYITTNFEKTTDGDGGFCTDGGGNPVYVLRKTGGNDVIPANEGILSIKGHNYPVWQPFLVESGAILRIRTNINRATYINDGNLINYGSIIYDSLSQAHPTDGTIACVRHGGIDGSITGATVNNAINRYKPSYTVPLIHINTPNSSPTSSSSSFNTSSSGFVSGFLLGSMNQGGFNAIIELAGKSSSFSVTSNSPMTWNNRQYYNHLVYIADLETQSGSGSVKRVQINNAYLACDFREHLIGGVNGINSANFIMSVGQGEIGVIGINDIISPSITTSLTDVLRTNSFLQIANTLYNSSLLGTGREYDDNADAISGGLKRGMIYRTNDGTSSILKIVH